MAELDSLCGAIDTDADFRLHENSCASLLQTVRCFPLMPRPTRLRHGSRIFTNGRVVYAIRSMVVLVSIWTVAFFIANVLQCFPISVNWTGWGASADSCINTNAMFLAQAWSDVLTDGNCLVAIWRRQGSDKLNSYDSLTASTMRTLSCSSIISLLHLLMAS